MFRNILFASHTTSNTILWNFFLLKKTPTTSVTFLLRRFAKGIWIPSMIMTPSNVRYTCKIFKTSHDVFQMLTWKNTDVYLNNYFLSINTSQTMLTYFLIVDAPTLNQSAICVALNSKKIKNNNSHNIFNF
jgi:hypothetical protein